MGTEFETAAKQKSDNTLYVFMYSFSSAVAYTLIIPTQTGKNRRHDG